MSEILDLVFGWFTSKLLGKRGPLEVRAQRGEDVLTLTLENLGRRTLRYAAIRARDASGKVHFPTASLTIRTVLPKGEVQYATIDMDELDALHCSDLEVLDTSGAAWPVHGFQR